jgi:hypothetical protein
VVAGEVEVGLRVLLRDANEESGCFRGLFNDVDGMMDSDDLLMDDAGVVEFLVSCEVGNVPKDDSRSARALNDSAKVA